MIRIGIIGGAGYTAGELIRIIINHPACELSYVHSKSQAGKKVSAIHDDLIGEMSLIFDSDLKFDVDVLFLCLGHGESGKFLKENILKIDTVSFGSQDIHILHNQGFFPALNQISIGFAHLFASILYIKAPTSQQKTGNGVYSITG